MSVSFSSLAGTVAARLFLDRHLGFWLGELEPTWSLRETRARITAIVSETSDTKTFVLRPSRRFAGFVPGQYVPVEVEVDGARLRRCYSISSAPGAGRSFTITVKRVEGGAVSTWLHDRARVGDVIRLGEAAGDFVLPEHTGRGLLFVSGGSGITPIFSLLEDLSSRGVLENVVFVHYARSPEDVIFRSRLVALAERHLGFRLILRFTRGGSRERFSEEALRAVVPDFTERDAYLCGPPALMDAAEALWLRLGLADRLRRERFVSMAAAVPPPEAVDARVTLLRSGLSFASDGRTTLLEASERAGASPASGCRMGICHTCKCRKTIGTVQNLLTGEISSEPDEDIQLCISVARSDLELAI